MAGHYSAVAQQLLAMRKELEAEVLKAVKIHIDTAIANTCKIIEQNHTLTYVEAEVFDPNAIVTGEEPLAIHAVTLEAKGLAHHYWMEVTGD